MNRKTWSYCCCWKEWEWKRWGLHMHKTLSIGIYCILFKESLFLLKKAWFFQVIWIPPFVRNCASICFKEFNYFPRQTTSFFIHSLLELNCLTFISSTCQSRSHWSIVDTLQNSSKEDSLFELKHWHSTNVKTLKNSY